MHNFYVVVFFCTLKKKAVCAHMLEDRTFFVYYVLCFAYSQRQSSFLSHARNEERERKRKKRISYTHKKIILC